MEYIGGPRDGLKTRHKRALPVQVVLSDVRREDVLHVYKFKECREGVDVYTFEETRGK